MGVISSGTARLLAAAAALATVAACSSGGGGGGGAPPTPATYLFYADASGVTAVDPRNASTVRVSDVEPFEYALLTNGTYHEGGRVTGAHTQALVFWESDGGTDVVMKRVDAVLGGGAPAAARVSSLAVPDFCNWGLVPDYANAAHSAAYVESAGSDGSCWTGDDEVFLARMSMGAADPAFVTSSGGTWVLAPLYAANGAISGWLLEDGASLYGADAGFGGRTVLHTGTHALLAGGASRAWLDADGSLKHVAPGASALADPGGVATTLPASYAYALDETHLYVADTAAGGAILRVRRDGSAPAAVVHTLGGSESVASLYLTANRIVYEEGSTGTFYSVPKAGGAAATVYAPATPGNTVFAYPAGPSLLVYDDSDQTTASVAEDGSDLVELVSTAATSYWSFVAGDSFVPGDERWGSWAHAVLVEEDGTGGYKLRGFDARTRTPGPQLGTVPPGYGYPTTIAEGTGSATLVTAFDDQGFQDLFLVDTAKADSLVQLTETYGVGETPIGSQGCSSSGGVAAPALVAWLAWVGLRRRRGR